MSLYGNFFRQLTKLFKRINFKNSDNSKITILPEQENQLVLKSPQKKIVFKKNNDFEIEISHTNDGVGNNQIFSLEQKDKDLSNKQDKSLIFKTPQADSLGHITNQNYDETRLTFNINNEKNNREKEDTNIANRIEKEENRSKEEDKNQTTKTETLIGTDNNLSSREISKKVVEDYKAKNLKLDILNDNEKRTETLQTDIQRETFPVVDNTINNFKPYTLMDFDFQTLSDSKNPDGNILVVTFKNKKIKGE